MINSNATSASHYSATGGGSSSTFASLTSGSIFAGSGTFASLTSGSLFAGSSTFASLTSGSLFAGSMSSSSTFVVLSQPWAINAITNVVGLLSPLEQSLGATQSFMYRVPAVTWLEELKSTRHSIDEFALLREDWDGYGASPISDQARKHAHHFINEIEAAPFEVPVPEVSPTPTGTISFEWEAPHAEVYIEIGNTRYSGFIKTEQQEPIFLQGHADSMDQQIVALTQSAITAPMPSSAPTITEIRPQSQLWHERLAA